ncbi:hypothetical protein [Actinomadura sp. NPDC049753]|uniref:hypothetical protein n=1 Tax=Actinomadura sp. NPDC049753 TaxID=3154739 RepID=UPI00342A4324
MTPALRLYGPHIPLGALFGALLAGLAFGGFFAVAVGAFTGVIVAGCASLFAYYCAGVQSDGGFSVGQCIPLYLTFILKTGCGVVGLLIALRIFGS